MNLKEIQEISHKILADVINPNIQDLSNIAFIVYNRQLMLFKLLKKDEKLEELM